MKTFLIFILKFNLPEIFFHPTLSNTSNFSLNKEESNHCIKVLRLKENDFITIFDGKGNIIIGKIIEPNPKSTKIEVTEIKNSQLGIGNKIHIGIAPTKNINRFEWFIEKVIELGLQQITPIITVHSERTNLNFDRIQKKMISALKQSQNPFLPKLNPTINFTDFINSEINSQKFICHNEIDNIPFLKNQIKKNQQYLILIGPEGGFSPNEIHLAENQNFETVLLGDSRLRTETAGIIACNTVHLFAK